MGVSRKEKKRNCCDVPNTTNYAHLEIHKTAPAYRQSNGPPNARTGGIGISIKYLYTQKEQIGERVKSLAGTTVPVRDRALTRCKKPLIGYKPIRGLQVSLSRSEGENYLPTATAAAAVLILKGE